MSYMSGGVIQGHLPSPQDTRHAEKRLEDDGYDLSKIKRRLVSSLFTLAGPNRLAKVIPVLPEYGANDYPTGSGIPQWTLIKEMPFHVAAIVHRGQVYAGDYS